MKELKTSSGLEMLPLHRLHNVTGKISFGTQPPKKPKDVCTFRIYNTHQKFQFVLSLSVPKLHV